MLTRTDSSGTTKFECDGFDCARELAPTGGSSVYDTATYDSGVFGTGGATLYYVVGGELIGFKRDNAQFAVVSDALGSVRLVLDSTGATAAHFEYDAWGNLLASSVDGVPGGSYYRFVGGLGCWLDPATGLVYMRQRWYDPAPAHFANRDPIGLRGGIDLYTYAYNNPTVYVDPRGLSGWITINSKVADPSSSDSMNSSGHSWITFDPDSSGPTYTVSTWGSTNPPGLYYDEELNRTPDTSRTIYIDDAHQKKMENLIQWYKNQGPDAWHSWRPCSGFSADVWKTATGEDLSGGTPASLVTAINSANAAGGANSSGGSSNSSDSSGNSISGSW